MLCRPTTLVTTYRGTTTDTYGDPQDTATAYLTDVPASILERTDYVQTQEQSTPIIVRRYTGRVGANTDIKVGDRLLDQNTGTVYMIDSYSTTTNPIIAQDTNLTLRILS